MTKAESQLRERKGFCKLNELTQNKSIKENASGAMPITSLFDHLLPSLDHVHTQQTLGGGSRGRPVRGHFIKLFVAYQASSNVGKHTQDSSMFSKSNQVKSCLSSSINSLNHDCQFNEENELSPTVVLLWCNYSFALNAKVHL